MRIHTDRHDDEKAAFKGERDLGGRRGGRKSRKKGGREGEREKYIDRLVVLNVRRPWWSCCREEGPCLLPHANLENELNVQTFFAATVRSKFLPIG